MKRRALLSVYDKTGLVEFACGLAELGFELIASGGTARALSAASLPVIPVERVTGFPEILGGRVKTLHPAIHGGILARRTPEHLAELAAHGIAPMDLVVCNLYPFAATVARPGVTEAEAVEEIDIGGVTLLRAAAKNFEAVTVVCDPADYPGVLALLRGDQIPTRRETSPIVGEAPPILGRASPIRGKASPTLGEASPIQGEAFPIRGKASPTLGEAFPIQGEASPIRGEASPTLGEASPIQGEASPIRGEASPTLGKASPTLGEVLPAPRETAPAEISLAERRRLALKAFSHTAAYDAAIATWLGGAGAPDPPAPFPGRACPEPVEGEGEGVSPLSSQERGRGRGEDLPLQINLSAERIQLLRYGENPHQQAALYRWTDAPFPFAQLQGKELSYNNLVDLDAAWAMAQEFAEPAVAIIKHTNPSGLATAASLAEAYRLALACDPVSAFGSVIAVNLEVDRSLVEEIGSLFVEVLVAPGYTADALAWLAGHKKNCRVLVACRSGLPVASTLAFRSVAGGLLVQTADDRGVDESTWRVVTKRQPTEAERRSLAFAWLAVKHVKSNAIVFVQGTATVGVGAGQMNRVDSVYLAGRRAGDRARGAVMGSDAFFPFPDGIEAAAAAGVTACIQPGGSLRDEEAIAAADKWSMAMVFTGERHFRH